MAVWVAGNRPITRDAQSPVGGSPWRQWLRPHEASRWAWLPSLGSNVGVKSVRCPPTVATDVIRVRRRDIHRFLSVNRTWTGLSAGRSIAMLPGMYEHADWAALTAAYFDHQDMRELFDGLRSDDANEVGLAWEELAPSVMESGEVFESTAAAIPLLLGLVRTARHERAETLRIVGQCADPNRAYGDRLPMVQAALAAHADLVRAFVNDDDPEVREAAQYTLNQCGHAGPHHPQTPV